VEAHQGRAGDGVRWCANRFRRDGTLQTDTVAGPINSPNPICGTEGKHSATELAIEQEAQFRDGKGRLSLIRTLRATTILSSDATSIDAITNQVFTTSVAINVARFRAGGAALACRRTMSRSIISKSSEASPMWMRLFETIRHSSSPSERTPSAKAREPRNVPRRRFELGATYRTRRAMGFTAVGQLHKARHFSDIYNIDTIRMVFQACRSLRLRRHEGGNTK